MLERVLQRLVRHNPRRTDHLFGQNFTPMGHRGASGLAPENTLASVRAAIGLGVPFEIDVALCASGEAVVLHDDTLDRTTDGCGPVNAMGLDALKALNAGDGERIPTLAQVLETARDRVLVNMELKTTRHRERLVRTVARTVRAHSAEDQVIITSFDPYILQRCRALAPGITRGQIYSTFEDVDLERYKRFALKNLLLNHRAQPDLLMVEHSMVDAAYLERMQGLGYRVFAWTVNDVPRMRDLVSLGINGIITDHPDLLLAELNRAAP